MDFEWPEFLQMVTRVQYGLKWYKHDKGATIWLLVILIDKKIGWSPIQLSWQLAMQGGWQAGWLWNMLFYAPILW